MITLGTQDFPLVPKVINGLDVPLCVLYVGNLWEYWSSDNSAAIDESSPTWKCRRSYSCT